LSYKNRWTQPTEREPREEYYALRQELKKSALTKFRRTEIETRLDELALNPNFKGTLQEKSILSAVPPAKPPIVRHMVDELAARVKQRPSEMLLRAADIDAVRSMDLRAARSEWYKVIQSQWPEKGFERIMQRGWLVNWRIATLDGDVSEPFADYWKRCHESFVVCCAFMERFKVASPTEQAVLVAEKYGLTK
jgi:hypothetical protein